ncbi:MAG: HD domain-containing protein [Chthoniobacterales bacterium]
METTSFLHGKLKQQIDFILEIDKLKTVLRKTKILHEDRHENSAEHSWQLALAAIILAEYANEQINITHVIKMLLIHDLVEVYSGDTFHYHKETDETLSARELEAAEKIFGLLPQEQGKELLSLWIEFDCQQTPEAKFATSIDRLMPMLLHSHSDHKIWNEFSITSKQVIDKNQHINNGSTALWHFAQEMIRDAVEKGHFA